MAEIGYCLKCKKSQKMIESEEITMKNGRKAIRGKCPICNTTIYKILGKS